MRNRSEAALAAVEQSLRDRLLQGGRPSPPAPGPTPEQLAELAAAGVEIPPGVPVVINITRPRVVVPVTPDMDCIGETQCVALRGLVRTVVDRHHAPYQTVWSSLNLHMGVSSYRLIHAGAATRAVAFLEHWRDTGLPPIE